MNPSVLEPPQAALDALLKLQDYYATVVTEYERSLKIARMQLGHVEALIDGLSSDKQISPPHEQSSNLLLEEEEDIPFPQPLLSNEFFVVNEASSEQQLPLLEYLETQAQERSLHGVEIPMLPQYQSLTRPEAIKQILAQNIGAIVHIDFILRSLYGELEGEAFKVVKGRVQSSLTQGRENNKWSNVPGEPGCYTLSLSLVNPGNKIPKSKTKPQKRKPPIISMLTVLKYL